MHKMSVATRYKLKVWQLLHLLGNLFTHDKLDDFIDNFFTFFDLVIFVSNINKYEI